MDKVLSITQMGLLRFLDRESYTLYVRSGVLQMFCFKIILSFSIDSGGVLISEFLIENGNATRAKKVLVVKAIIIIIQK